MAVPPVAFVAGLALAVVGTATATDAVSLREIARHVDLPLVSASIIALREAMPNSVAHTLEPLAAMAGLAMCAAPPGLRGAARGGRDGLRLAARGLS